ncbi:MAG TPA: beta-propeller fold lactonase family protein [Gemmatimonadaceae bacterium]|jgi:DNA-binding beta-propeller fold protein YncE
MRDLFVASVALLLAAAPAARAQDACNAPAKDPLVQLDMPGRPFEPVISADGCWVFVTITSGGNANGGQVSVVRRSGGALSVARTFSLKGNPTGAVLTHDGKLLIVASGDYLAFLDAARLESGDADPVLGYIGNGSPVGYIYVNVSADDRYLFAAAESGAAILVVDLEQVRAGGFNTRGGVAKLDVGIAPIAVTLSPDGRYLYTTSEVALPAWGWPTTCRPENPNARRNAANHPQGAIIIFDVSQILKDPSHAAVSRVAAGCNPVRLVLSPRGDVAYVSARDDNALEVFDTQRLVTDGGHALVGRAEVGVAPVGVAVIDSGARVVVTSSNRFSGGANDRQPLTVVDAGKLRAGAPSVVGTIPAGAFPRELRLTADGRTLFVTNFASRSLEMIDLGRAPLSR